MNQIIKSLLENDMYKFSMGQAIYHQYPSYRTTWTFKCRNTWAHFTEQMVSEIKEQIKAYCELRFTECELDYLRTIPWIKDDYVDFLRLWHPNFNDFDIKHNPASTTGLSIETTGTWLNTSMYEVPVLAIVNEVYFKTKHNYAALFDTAKIKTRQKIKCITQNLWRISNFSEFGLRRRLSGENQEYVIKHLADINWNMCEHSKFIGTSNVYLARKYNIKATGTQAHEWIMCVGQGNPRHNPAYSNYYALKAWAAEYGVLNGIALTDTIRTDLFLLDFDRTFATLFSGVRHDSGDPVEWGHKILNHYRELGIDPKTKTLLFSDSLTFQKAQEINSEFKNLCDTAFGIGTYLSNDTSTESLNIVMKVTECNGRPVAKLSDNTGKCVCKSEEYLSYLRTTITQRKFEEE